MSEFQRNKKLSKGQDVILDTVLWRFCIKCQKDKPMKGSKMLAKNMYACQDCLEKKHEAKQ